MVDDHIALSNPRAADKFALSVFRRVKSIANLGLTGVARPEFGDGIHSIAYSERIIFFHVTESELIVLRVMHGHQDISADDFLNIED